MRLVLYRGKWCAYLGSGRRVSLRTADRLEAERRLNDLLRSKDRKTETVAGIVDLYLKEKVDAPSYPSMLFQWKNALPHFGHLRPDQITRQICREYAAKRKGASNSTIRKEIGIVRAAVRWHSPQAPAVFELPPNPPPKDRYLTREEYDRLLAECHDHHLRLYVMLAIATAGRKSAILELTWDRVDFDSGLIHLGTGEKRVKGRATVPMTRTVREALLNAQKGAITERVIEYGGHGVKNIVKAFRAACKRAGLDGVTPHTLRHSAASWMAMSGVSMAEIAAYLGHTDSRITERVYAKFSPDYLRKAAEALEG